MIWLWGLDQHQILFFTENGPGQHFLRWRRKHIRVGIRAKTFIWFIDRFVANLVLIWSSFSGVVIWIFHLQIYLPSHKYTAFYRERYYPIMVWILIIFKFHFYHHFNDNVMVFHIPVKLISRQVAPWSFIITPFLSTY